MTILAIFLSSAPKRLHMKFEQHWPRGFRGEVIWNYQHVFHANVWGPYRNIQEQTWPRRKKVKRQCTIIILATLVDFPFPMICAKIQPQGILEKKIFKVFTIYGYGSHLGQWTATILAIFHSPALGRLQMKFEQHWPRGSRGEVVWNSQHFPIQIQMHREANLTSL